MAISKGSCKFLRLFAIMVVVANSSPASAQILQRLFGPADYEACMAENITAAETPSAQRAVSEDCNSRFPARRDGRGGYEYCSVAYPDRSSFDVSIMPSTEFCNSVAGPSLSEDEWAEVDRLYESARTRSNALWDSRNRISLRASTLLHEINSRGQPVVGSGGIISNGTDFDISVLVRWGGYAPRCTPVSRQRTIRIAVLNGDEVAFGSAIGVNDYFEKTSALSTVAGINPQELCVEMVSLDFLE